MMQDLAWVRRFRAQKLIYPILGKPRIPPPPKIGTSHGGLREFGSEVSKNPPPNENCSGLWI